jgi:hypothetical protein
MVGIEVKAPKGKPNPDQQAFIDRINFEGGIAFVARSVEDVFRGLGIEEKGHIWRWRKE